MLDTSIVQQATTASILSIYNSLSTPTLISYGISSSVGIEAINAQHLCAFEV